MSSVKHRFEDILRQITDGPSPEFLAAMDEMSRPVHKAIARQPKESRKDRRARERKEAKRASHNPQS